MLKKTILNLAENFERGITGNISVSIMDLDQWFKDMSFKDISTFSSGGHLSTPEQFVQFWKGALFGTFCEIILNLG